MERREIYKIGLLTSYTMERRGSRFELVRAVECAKYGRPFTTRPPTTELGRQTGFFRLDCAACWKHTGGNGELGDVGGEQNGPRLSDDDKNIRDPRVGRHLRGFDYERCLRPTIQTSRSENESDHAPTTGMRPCCSKTTLGCGPPTEPRSVRTRMSLRRRRARSADQK
ncbi:hypothetical protein AG1IA_09506 [Rhizoctonia solani AG-1 IA]|uniref:Uncharacterized protein n=1 Tax=Thanatephorus cucumeris (strain AG1-IA) TaxID=983506 RepID=L8WE57_THACA|nr:hypothetical protein AG1IA_09506 [Rhizoctonia solani AG-1 IA]